MDIFHAVILGVIEGITEFLPVSSTGHAIMVSQMMQIPQTDFLKTFEIAIQLGAVVAVVGVYWRTFLLDWEIDAKILTAYVPSAIIGLLLYKMIKHSLIGNAWVVVWAWFLGGAFIILFERFNWIKGEIVDIKKISYTQALLIGVCQAFAVIPGVSRAATAILGGMMMGIERKVMVDFSLLLAVPCMLTVIVYETIKADADMTSDQWGILMLGFLVAFLVAWGSVKFFLNYVKRHHLTAFGIYRVVVALAAGLFLNLLFG